MINKIRWFLSQTVVKWLRQIRILGWIRFRIIRYCYKIMWSNSPYNGWWDFILEWMGNLRQWQKPVRVLDVGCTESLLIYELEHRGYEVTGIDQRPYQEYNKNTHIVDLTKTIRADFYNRFDYILAVSSIEHIGLGAYGDNKEEQGDRHAMKLLFLCLKNNGYFMLFIPNKHLGSPSGRGYSYSDLEELINGLFKIVHFQERNNQICAVLVKKV